MKKNKINMGISIRKRITSAAAFAIMVSFLAACAGNQTDSGGAGTYGGNASSGGSSNFNTNSTISVISREEGSGTRGAFIELFGVEVKGDDGSKKDMTTKEADIVNKTDVMLTNVSTDPYAIGYVSIGSLSSNVRALSIDGVKPSSENVKNGTYKISRPFNIATKGEMSELTADFVGYILSKEGQEVVSASYVPIDDSAAPYSGSKPSGKIVIAGSSSVSPLMEKLKEAYEVLNPNAVIEIQTTDSGAGMTSAIEGTCDIGMASRDLSDKEAAELHGQAIALDGIAVIVNNGNPLTNISKEQVKDIFTGVSSEWSDVIN